MRVRDGRLSGARLPAPTDRLPRIPSERSDVEHLAAAGEQLVKLIRADVVAAGPLLNDAIFAMQMARSRAMANRDHRDARKAARSTTRRRAA